MAAPSEEQVSPPPLSPPPLSPTLLPTAVPCRALALRSADPPPRAPGRQEHGRGHGAAGGERREGAAQGRLGHPAKSTLGQVTDQEGGTAARSKRRLKRRRSCTYGRRPLSPGGARTYRVAGGVRTGSKRRLSSAELGSCASCASCGSGRPMTPRLRGPGCEACSPVRTARRLRGVHVSTAGVSTRPKTPRLRGLLARTFSTVRTRGRSVRSTVEAPTWQCPGSAPVPPQGAPGSSGWLGAPGREIGPAGLS